MRVAVVIAEPGGLDEDRRDGEPGAVHRAVVGLEILRRHPEIIADGVGQTRHDGFLKCRNNAIAKARAFCLPVDISEKVRHRTQHIETVTPVRCETVIRGGRPVKIERKIIRQDLAVENISEKLAVAWPHPDGVMRDILIFALCAEEQHVKPHRIGCRRFRKRPLRARFARQHLLIDSRRIAVADHPRRRETPTIRGLGTGGAPTCHGDPFDVGAKLDPHAAAFQKTMQLRDKLAGAAHAEEHAPAPLKIMDQRIDRGGGERIATHQKRMDRKSLSQQRVLDMAVHQPGHRAVTAKLQQRRHLCQHRAEPGEGLVCQLLEPHFENSARCVQQPRIAGHITRREPPDLFIGVLDGGTVVELAAIVEMEPVPGVERPEFEMILAALAKQFEQFVEQERRGDDRRPGIVTEAAALEHLRASANGLQPVDKCHRIAARPHAERRRDAAKTGTDDKNVAGDI